MNSSNNNYFKYFKYCSICQERIPFHNTLEIPLIPFWPLDKKTVCLDCYRNEPKCSDCGCFEYTPEEDLYSEVIPIYRCSKYICMNFEFIEEANERFKNMTQYKRLQNGKIVNLNEMLNYIKKI